MVSPVIILIPGSSPAQYLEGTSVPNVDGAGNAGIREGVFVADPSDTNARASVLNGEPGSGEYGGTVRVVGLHADLVSILNKLNAGLAVTGEVEVKNDVGNPLPVNGTVALDSATLAALENTTVTVGNFPATQQTKDTTDIEYTPVAGTATSAGDNFIYTPASGKRVRIHWVYAVNDPTAASIAKITINLGANTYYCAWDVMKRQQFTGPVDGKVNINLSQAGNVAYTVFLEEI